MFCCSVPSTLYLAQLFRTSFISTYLSYCSKFIYTSILDRKGVGWLDKDGVILGSDTLTLGIQGGVLEVLDELTAATFHSSLMKSRKGLDRFIYPKLRHLNKNNYFII